MYWLLVNNFTNNKNKFCLICYGTTSFNPSTINFSIALGVSYTQYYSIVLGITREDNTSKAVPVVSVKNGTKSLSGFEVNSAWVSASGFAWYAFESYYITIGV